MIKLPPIKKVRIPLLLALVLAEIAGLLHFYKTQNFVLFLLISALGTAFTAALLWVEWTETHGLYSGDLANYLLILGLGIEEFVNGHRFLIEVSAVLLLLVLMPTLRQLSHPKNNDLQQTSLLEVQRKKDRYGSGGYLLSAVLSLVALGSPCNVLWDRHVSFFWSFPLAPPIIWYAWQYVLDRREQKRLNPDGNLALINR